MKQTFTFFLFLMFLLGRSHAQCPSNITSDNAFFLNANPTQCTDPLTSMPNITLNLRFILVQNSNGFGPTEADVQAGLNKAITDFAPANITFNDCYKIVHRDISIASFYDYHDFGPDDLPGFINIYVFGGFPEGPPGLACFSAPRLSIHAMSMERWLSHEIGHVLQLYHTHEDIGEEERVTRGEVPNCDCNCTQTGDLVCDTPPDSGSDNFDCIFSNSENFADPCNIVYVDPDNILGENIMSYYNCPQQRFETGQLHRMRMALNQVPHLSQLVGNGGECAADYWVSDGTVDDGTEPSTVENFWKSTAIYSSDGWTGGDGVLNIMHETGQDVEISVDVKNIGGLIHEPGKIKLYWAQASAGLHWESPFDGVLLNACDEPLGGFIQEKNLVTIQPGGTHTYQFTWTPPDPDNYIDCFGDGWEHRHFCILARIETSTQDPFGLSYFETDNLGTNVRNNNGIALRNISLYGNGIPGAIVTTDPNDQIIIQDYFLYGNYTKGGMDNVQLMVNFPNSRDAEMLRYVDVEIRQGRQNSFMRGNQDKTPSKRMGPGAVERFCLRVVRNGIQPPLSSIKGRFFEMDIIQMNGREVIGGETFMINLENRQRAVKDRSGQQISDKVQIDISPNPFKDVLRINSPEQGMRLAVYNGLGQLVYNQAVEPNGHTVNLKDQDNGIYFVEIFAQNGRLLKAQKVVKIE